MSFKQSSHCLSKWYYYIYSELFHLNYVKAPLKSKTLFGIALFTCIPILADLLNYFTLHHLILNNGEINSMFIEQ